MNTLDYLHANEHKSENGFVTQAEFIRDNWPWLKYSYAIAIKVRRRMSDLGFTQKQLAEVLGCSQQHISVLLNGRVNMTLETLAKLEQALDFDLIGASLQDYHYPVNPRPEPAYLNDSSAGGPAVGIKTSDLVDGYKTRKKKGPKKK
jgi:transcriptional regulator with XRE-family HTH domain